MEFEFYRSTFAETRRRTKYGEDKGRRKMIWKTQIRRRTEKEEDDLEKRRNRGRRFGWRRGKIGEEEEEQSMIWLEKRKKKTNRLLGKKMVELES